MIHSCAWKPRKIDFDCEACLALLHTGKHDDLLRERLDWARRSTTDRILAEVNAYMQTHAIERDRAADADSRWLTMQSHQDHVTAAERIYSRIVALGQSSRSPTDTGREGSE